MLRKLLTRTNGSVAIEYSIVLPLVLLFFVGLADVGRALWSYTTLARAVASAAECGAVNTTTCGTSTAVASYGVAQAVGLALSSANFTITAATCGTKVQGSFAFKFYIPWTYIAAPFGAANQLTLSTTACFPS